jgi:hypothetical protein
MMPAMKPPSSSSLLCFVCIVALTSLAACFGPNTAWVKKGAGPDELHAAQRDCNANASQYSFVDEAHFDDMARDRGSSAQGDIYRHCMETMGWHRERTDQGPK